MRFQIYQQKNEKYEQIFKFPPINWCNLNDNKAKLFGFQKLFVKAFKYKAGGFFHTCPFEGKHSLLNLTASRDVIDILPLGKMRLIATLFNDQDSKIAIINISYVIYE